MKIWLVARKSLLEAVREPQLLLLTLALPLIFLGITKISYNTPLQATFPILLLDPDGIGAALTAELAAQQYEDGRSVFAITPAADQVAAEAQLKDGSAALLLLINNQCAANNKLPLRDLIRENCFMITALGDAVAMPYYKASTILDSVLYRYTNQVVGLPPVVEITAVSLRETAVAPSPQTEFDLYAPGMMIFAWLMLVPQTALLLAREIRGQTLRRLRLTRLHAWQLLGGITLAQMMVALVQVLLVFLAARWLGFHSQGTLWAAAVVGLAISLGAVGMGLMVACFVENDSQAANIGSSVSMLQVFVSGAFYAMPPLTLFTLGGHQIDLFDISPATSGMLALQQVLAYGADLRDVAFRLGVMGVGTAVYFILGIVIFQRRQMQ
ncbi:MAG: ABC transporter permease [Anaerolineales bacterium]|nr:ABC transporter permease [Anaerolineales bacterium]